LTARGAVDILILMDPISGAGSTPPAQSADIADSSVNLALLKQAQDLAKDNASRLLELLPPPRSPNPPGTGGKLDLMA
jgi:hypothetical protein